MLASIFPNWFVPSGTIDFYRYIRRPLPDSFLPDASFKALKCPGVWTFCTRIKGARLTAL